MQGGCVLTIAQQNPGDVCLMAADDRLAQLFNQDPVYFF